MYTGPGVKGYNALEDAYIYFLSQQSGASSRMGEGMGIFNGSSYFGDGSSPDNGYFGYPGPDGSYYF